MMNHAVPRVQRCVASPCVRQRFKDNILLKTVVIYLVLSASTDFKVCNLYTVRAFEHFIVHSTKICLHFLNPNTALKNKIIIRQNGGFVLGTPGYGLCHHIRMTS